MMLSKMWNMLIVAFVGALIMAFFILCDMYGRGLLG